jgi:hypothetical protein
MMTTRVEALLQGQLASVTSVGRRQIFQSVLKKKKKKSFSPAQFCQVLTGIVFGAKAGHLF